MKNKMYITKKLGFICLVLLVALGTLGVSYAKWSQNLNVAATVTTGAAPAVTTNAATSVGSTSATLNGSLTGLGAGASPTVNLFFEYGNTTSYGTTVAGTPSSATTVPTAFNAALTGLQSSTTYHFRAKAVGLFTKYGGDQQFTSAGTPTSVDKAPGLSIPTSGKWTSPDYVFALDTSRADCTDSTQVQQYGNFGFSIPSGSTITGIVVTMVGLQDSPKNGYLTASLSWNNGTSFVGGNSTYRTTNFQSAIDLTLSVGGSTNTWGRTWLASEFNNGYFTLKLDPVGSNMSGSNKLRINYVHVTVYYTPP